jgi:hypothetical protein
VNTVHRFIFKFALVLVMIYLALDVMSNLVRTLNRTELLAAGAATSYAAYTIRERRRGPERRPRSGSGGERTPLMPSKNA